VAFPPDNRPFSVPAGGAPVTFYFDGATNNVWEEVTPTVSDEDLVAAPVQAAIQDEVMYFVLPDRFDNGDPSNDEGAFPGGTLAETGFKPDDKAFYHGGDLAGLQGKLDYLAGLGRHSDRMTPVLKNKPTQPDSSKIQLARIMVTGSGLRVDDAHQGSDVAGGLRGRSANDIRCSSTWWSIIRRTCRLRREF
jgi:hypothetical protein